ncbi:T9SS type A sorting domain-containing protein [Flexithrix dorotheae]|uniref:T9SS type A sorting domain-containing protein n=1 Tax=Flexithrix dorotheae TaxID=70993 RepID=UPI0003799D70|nr:T9SS type A sorting domain-containing protein [Flexithrix dorotheae]
MKKHYKLFIFLPFCLIFGFSAKVSASSDSVKVDVNLDVKHEVGHISTFDRKKFITIHSDITEQEWDGNNFTPDLRDHFLNGYDVYLGRNTGGISWWLNTMITEDSLRPGYANPGDITHYGNYVRNEYGNKSNYHHYESRNEQIICAQLHPFWPDGKTTQKGWAFSQTDTEEEPFGTATGEYMGRFIKDFFGTGGINGQNRPKYVEIINEPLWHLVDFGTDKPEDIFKFHNAVAKEIRKYNEDLVIGGYCTAFPDHETNNFEEWEERWKLFMDIAGENMDFWTIHLYDFPSINNGKQLYRKGSNMEATFDIMEQYSYMKFEEVKPFMISEYGAQMHDYAKQWTPYRDWLHIKSVNSMLMQFMERPHIINKTIPFNPLKAEWGRAEDGSAYNHRMLRKANELPGQTGEEYVYTEFVKIYQLWSDVKGTRVDSYSTDLDIMVDAYVDGNKAYVILNNLNFSAVDIDLNLMGFGENSVEKVSVKHLYLEGQNPILKEEELPEIPDGMTIESEGTIILAYTLAGEITIPHLSTEEKLYAEEYLKPIEGGKTESFNIKGVPESEFGEAVLRLGIGRNHGKSLKPVISFNGTALEVPENFRGDLQNDRPNFYGVLEIPVPLEIIKKENTITVTFSDNGGHISSVALQHYTFTREITRSAKPPVISGTEEEDFGKKKVEIYPNPAKTEINLKTPTSYLGEGFSIHNYLGKAVKSGIIQKEIQAIELGKLPAGLYFLRFENDGNLAKGYKFIME